MNAVRLTVGLAIVAGLYLTSLYSYNLFHGLVEFFSIVVAAGVFVIAWNARAFSDNNYLLVLGCAFVCVAMVDTLHTLAYQGLGVFPDYTTDLPTQLWLAGRYLYLLGLLAAPFAIRRRARPGLYLGGFVAFTAVLVGLIFAGYFPQAYVVGEGLTTFKVASEYAVCALLLAAAWLLWRERNTFDRTVYLMLTASILVTVVSELLFTLYVSPFGPSNLAGHLLKLVSFLLVYRAVIQTALVRPYRVLFRELKSSEEILREKEEQQRHIADVLQEALLTTPESIPGVDFGHSYRPAAVAGKVGGDFYDLFALGSRSVAILIGDVSGHGVEAAAFTSLAKNTIEAFAFEGEVPTAALAKANLVTIRTHSSSDEGLQFLTAFYGTLNLDDGRLEYAVAGHPPGMIRRREGANVELLRAGSPVIGVFPEASYPGWQAEVRPGDTLLLYTDGLTECRRGSELFGQDRLLDLLASMPHVSAPELPDRIFEAAMAFCEGDLRDDVAILALTRDGRS